MAQAYFSRMLPGTHGAFRPCPEDLWRRLCSSDPTCTFYQTPDWLNVAVEYLRGVEAPTPIEVAPWLFELAEGPMVLPLLRRKRFGAWRYASPFGTYTAPVTPATLGDASRRKVIEALSAVNVQLTSSPFTPNAVQVGRPLAYSIQCVDLTALDPGQPTRDWEEGQQRRVRVSRRTGVTLRPARDASDWRRYFELYGESLGRWGENATTAYGEALFEALRSRLSGNPCMTLWLAEVPGAAAVEAGLMAKDVAPESVIAAGYLTFYHNRHVVPWHGAGAKDYFRFGVTQALFAHMMADAARRGFAHFDLTGSSGLRGVAEFKSRFGTREMIFEGSLQQVGLYGLLSQVKSGVTAFMRRRAAGPG